MQSYEDSLLDLMERNLKEFKKDIESKTERMREEIAIDYRNEIAFV
jgi:hypothetical protein